MDATRSFRSDSELRTEEDPANDTERTERTQKPPKRKIARKRTTHLRLQNHNLRNIPNLATCKDLLVLYLYNNKIDCIQNLDVFSKLTHLYLTHNNIKRLENMTKLENLEKLYIGHNKITVLEGLEGLRRLRELHMEAQRLPSGDSLSFDPRSIQAIRGTLHVLNIESNGVTSLRPLKPLSYLSDLVCADNQLSSLVDAKETISELPSLTRLDLKGNALCRLQRYRDAIVESAPLLCRLDDLEVTPSYRQFVCGRGQAVARRLSVIQQRPMPSASDDAVIRERPARGGVSPPQVALSQGNLLQTRRTSTQPRQSSSTHLRVGNMLTLTPQRRALVRAASRSQSQSDAQVETSAGDLQQLTGWSGRRDTLPGSPARKPVGADARSARPSVSQPDAHAAPSIGHLGQPTAWPGRGETISGGADSSLLCGTVSEELPNRMALVAVAP